jgi:hypothetical protein
MLIPIYKNIAVSDSNDGELTDSGADGILGIGKV